MIGAFFVGITENFNKICTFANLIEFCIKNESDF
jgi:hypothetical protein